MEGRRKRGGREGKRGESREGKGEKREGREERREKRGEGEGERETPRIYHHFLLPSLGYHVI